MSRPFVVLINRSTVVADAAVQALLPALQTQVTRDLAPAWSLPGADLGFIIDKNMMPPADAWQIIIGDDSDQIGALGYHDRTSANLPIGFCFAKTDLEYGEVWQRTLSHELCELLVDPQCNSMTSGIFQGKTVYTLREVCDPVEDDRCGYDINGQPVSDFVYPAFYDTVTQHPFGTVFDHGRILTAPMTIARGGYMSVMDPNSGAGWNQVFGQHVPMHKRSAPVGSRRERRKVGPARWRNSTAA